MTFAPHDVLVDGSPTTYRVHAPEAVEEPAPLILFLHGAGESGTDGLAPTTVGLGPAVQRYPAVVVFPQASRGYGWRGFNMHAAVAALDDAERRYATDPRRVYLTGISMGGYGAWLLALLHPERFAAVVPICGGLDVATAIQTGALTRDAPHAQAARRLKDVPQWVFHGDADNVIPVEESRYMVAALRDVGAADVRYTEYPAVRHNSWDRAYAEPELLRWLFQQRRGV